MRSRLQREEQPGSLGAHLHSRLLPLADEYEPELLAYVAAKCSIRNVPGELLSFPVHSHVHQWRFGCEVCGRLLKGSNY
jgi:hypothetical protein